MTETLMPKRDDYVDYGGAPLTDEAKSLLSAVFAGKVLQWRWLDISPHKERDDSWHSIATRRGAMEQLTEIGGNRKEFRIQLPSRRIFLPVYKVGVAGQPIIQVSPNFYGTLVEAEDDKDSQPGEQVFVHEIGLDPEDGSLRYVKQHRGSPSSDIPV